MELKHHYEQHIKKIKEKWEERKDKLAELVKKFSIQSVVKVISYSYVRSGLMNLNKIINKIKNKSNRNN